MGKKKTIQDYELEIKTLHEEYKKTKDPSIKKKLNNRLPSWAALVDVTVYVANNEQKPFSSDEIGYPTLPMLTKKEYEKRYGKGKGVPQVADYQAFITFGSSGEWCTTLIERKGGKKGCEDFYGTLMNADGRDRFYGEISRYQEDTRFKRMIVLVESSMPEFMMFVPPFCGKYRNTDHIGACAESRYGTVASLFVKDVPILFCGTRYAAAKLYHKLIQQDIIKNYAYYLGLDQREEGKLIGEDHETLSFEVSGMRFRVRKEAVEVIA